MQKVIPKREKKIKVPIIWSPQPKQTEALIQTKFEILYGGARGGGKTDAGLAWLLFYKDNPRFRALVIRRNAKDLEDWIDRAQWMYRPTGAKFTGKPVVIEFPSGAKIRTGHLKDEDAYQQYRGHEYQRMVIEELTQIPSKADYLKLRSACRSTIDIPPRVFSTTNPDGPGFWWVKDYFRIPDNPTGNVETEETIDGQVLSRVFIPATLNDNPILTNNDPTYKAQLSQNDEGLKKAWVDGYWGEPIIEGVIFNEQLKALQADNRITEVSWDSRYPVYTYWDIGRDATPILFMQLIGNTWHMIDFYEASNQGFDHYAAVLKSKPYWYGQHFGPHDLRKTDMANETIWKIAESHGITFTIVEKATTFDGIDAAKAKFNRLKIDRTNCYEYIKRISAFRREYDNERKVYKDSYVHDWASHAGTATFYWGLYPDPIYAAGGEDFNLYKSNFS